MTASLTYEGPDGRLYLGPMPVGSLRFDADGRLYIGTLPPRHRVLATDEAPHFDKDGRLHLASMPLSKAAVEPYSGSTLIHARNGGSIDPNKTYRVFRPPSELAKAAHSFAGVPILNRHVYTSVADIPPDAVVGTVGSRVQFDDPVLAADAVIWSQQGVDGLAGGHRSAPSAGYFFDIEVRDGVFRGERFDAVFRNLKPHHIALVPRGRSDLQITPRAHA